MGGMEAEGEHPKSGASVAHGFYMLRFDLPHSSSPRLALPAIVEQTVKMPTPLRF